jgi:hypothetical protein
MSKIKNDSPSPGNWVEISVVSVVAPREWVFVHACNDPLKLKGLIDSKNESFAFKQKQVLYVYDKQT